MPQGLQFGLLFVGLIIGFIVAAAMFLGKTAGMREAANIALDKQIAHNRELSDAYAQAGQRVSDHERSLLDTTDQLRRQHLINSELQETIAEHAKKTCAREGCGQTIDSHDEYGRIHENIASPLRPCEGFTFKQSGLWSKKA